MGARAINAVLGLWLFFSTFLWPDTMAQRVTGWVIGALAVTAALAGLEGGKRGRRLNAALGGWLVVSALFVPRMRAATLWTDLIVGLGLIVFATAFPLGSLRRRRAEG